MMKKILKASPYYLEEVLGLDLEERAENGQLSFLLLNQPPVCDYHCRRCFMPDYRRGLYKHGKQGRALNQDEYLGIISHARDSGILSIEISGEGEPLLSKNLSDILSYANKMQMMATLITNGNTLTHVQNEFFKNNNVTLVFSLHTLDKKRYELDNKCKNSFERKIRNIETASKIYADTKIIENDFEIYRLAVHATLQRDNSHEIDDLRKFCHERDIFFSIAPLALVGKALSNPEIHPENGEKIIEDVVHYGDNSIIHSHSSVRVFGREVCGTAFYGLNIGWDGAILFDAHYGYGVGEQNLLGNIRDITFEEAVKNQRRYSRILFDNIGGSCPVRDPKGKEFLRKVLAKEILLLK